MATAEYYREYRKRNLEKRREYERIYRAKNRDAINSRQRKYRLSLKYKYMDQRQAAKERQIPWHLSFEEWVFIWKESGRLKDRGREGFVMARKGDEGPYSAENVEIISNSQNKADAYYNGKSHFAKTHTRTKS